MVSWHSLCFCAAQLHLGQVTADAGDPFPGGGQLLGVLLQRRCLFFQKRQGGGKDLGRLVEALLGRDAPLWRLGRFRHCLLQLIDALGSNGQAEVILGQPLIGKILQIGQALEEVALLGKLRSGDSSSARARP